MRAGAIVVLVGLGCGRIGFEATGDAGIVGDDAAGRTCTLAGHGYPTCARGFNQRMRCWGDNTEGELGDGTRLARTTPVSPLGLAETRAIGNGDSHTCAAASDGTAWCWGLNDFGQVGDGSMTLQVSPRQVAGLTDVVEIAPAQYHTCARTGDGRVWCWGGNGSGELGVPASGARLTPVEVPNVTGATRVVAGDAVTCAVRDGVLACWGYFNLLGDGSTASRHLPGQVPLPSRVVDVSTGCHGHACAVLEDGTAWCWGMHLYGQLGRIGADELELTPQRVDGARRWVQIGVGGAHTCARTDAGEVYCWGSGNSGKLGDGGHAADVTAPVRVALPTLAEDLVVSCARACARAGAQVWCWGTDDRVGYGGSGTPRSVHEITDACGPSS